eukprot:3146167-Prymnesium_polylepis.1
MEAQRACSRRTRAYRLIACSTAQWSAFVRENNAAVMGVDGLNGGDGGGDAERGCCDDEKGDAGGNALSTASQHPRRMPLAAGQQWPCSEAQPGCAAHDASVT